jgi:hypothetical protein
MTTGKKLEDAIRAAMSRARFPRSTEPPGLSRRRFVKIRVEDGG